MENSRRERERGIGSLCGVESSRNSSDARLLTFRLGREERVGVERGEERLSLSFRGFTLNVCRDFRDFELPFTNSGHSSFFKVVKSREQASSASLREIYSGWTIKNTESRRWNIETRCKDRDILFNQLGFSISWMNFISISITKFYRDDRFIKKKNS